MANKLTKKQRGFVKDYLETGNGTQSVLKNYDTDSPKVASVIAVENLAKPSIKELLESHAESAESRIFQLSQKAKSEMVSFVASKDIMDRAGYKPVEKSFSQAVNVNVEARLEDKSGFEAIREEYEEKLRKQLTDEVK